MKMPAETFRRSGLSGEDVCLHDRVGDAVDLSPRKEGILIRALHVARLMFFCLVFKLHNVMMTMGISLSGVPKGGVFPCTVSFHHPRDKYAVEPEQCTGACGVTPAMVFVDSAYARDGRFAPRNHMGRRMDSSVFPMWP